MAQSPKGKTAKITRIVFNPNRMVLVGTCELECGQPKSRNGLYAHYCYEWDEMLIDETDFEFDACNCGKPNART